MSRNYEPDCGLQKERPYLFRNLIALYRQELEYSLTDLSKIMNLNEQEMIKLYSIDDERPKLKLIANNRFN